MDTKRLDLNLLVTLEALLLEGNVTKAANRLNLSQPAVSAQLSRLRRLFNDPLLVPAQRGMTPTAKALELVAPLLGALDGVRATVTSHSSFDPAQAQLTVAIACTDYIQAAVAKPLAIKLRKDAPGVRIALRTLDISQLDTQMSRGEVDLALMTPDSAPSNLRRRHLFDEHYVLIGRRGHPRLHDGITAEEFSNLDHVVVSLRGGDFRTAVDDTLASVGHRRNVVLSAASFLFVPQLVIQSDFVALVPQRLAADYADFLQVVRCPLEVEGFEVGMVWHERNHTHTGQRWIRDAVISLTQGTSNPA